MMPASSSQPSEFSINVHLVRHQVFYTPIYLCQRKGSEGDFDLKFTIEEYELSDKKLVDTMFKGGNSKSDEIDIFVTGGPDVVDYLRKHPATERGKVYFWMPVVDRLPLPLITVKNEKEKRYADDSIRDMRKAEKDQKILSPPEDTTLNYFLSKFYDRTSFRKKYFDGLEPDEQQAIGEVLDKYHSIFDDKLEPQDDFDSITNRLKEDPSRLGFWLADDEDIRKLKKFYPPMEVVAFTCIYTRRDVWRDERKRAYLQKFCKHVSLHINQIHDFNRYFHREVATHHYTTGLLAPVFEILEETIKTDAQKSRFVSNLKFLAQNRIFATNINNDLILLGEEIQKTEDKKKFEPFYKLKLYYWISEGHVINALKAIDDLHEHDQAQMELLKNISASTHTFKTTLNTIFSAPLNSLRIQYPDDMRIKALSHAKDSVLQNANLINVLSKLTISGYGNISREKALEDSGLYSSISESINISEIIVESLEIWHMDKEKSLNKIILTGEEDVLIDPNFLRFHDLFPTRNFFEMIILTIIENCYRHAMRNKDKTISLSVTANKRELKFSNPAKPQSNDFDILTGNLRVVHYLLKSLENIGKVLYDPGSDSFTTRIVSFNNY